jgi:ParB family transcriptional regulator, chromosome partitioning protein
MSKSANIIAVDPFRCRMWDLHDRIEHHVDEVTCRLEIESISKHGQLVPALGRRIHNDPLYDMELIYGARRLFVARHLNKPVLIELRELSDVQGIVAMDIENRHRRDISPYERGLSYQRWLRGGYFKSQDDIARSLNVSASQVSRLLQCARLPAVVLGAFPNPVEICETWAVKLADVLEDPQSRDMTCTRARQIAKLAVRPPSRDVYRQLLLAAKPGRTIKPAAHDEVVKNHDGAPLFRIRRQMGRVSFLISTERVHAGHLAQLRSAITTILVSAELTARSNRAEEPLALVDSKRAP